MKRALCVGLLVATVGCASMSAKKELKGAMAAVQSAQSAGANNDPAAQPKLSQAESELGRARELLQGGNSKEAKSAAQSAYEYAEQALQILRSKGQGEPAAAALTR
jgi:multidrug resistance efflux pump